MDNLKDRIDKKERIQRAAHEHISILPYNPAWPRMFEQEKHHLQNCLPSVMIGRIEHFGSTAVPGLAAKPIIDMLVEVSSLEEAKTSLVPILEAQGYEYFWRPTHGDNGPPFYAWFIKRDAGGNRTHHIHMVERNFEHWDRLLFRDYLIKFPAIAKEYEAIKYLLVHNHPHDRAEYTNGKTAFIEQATRAAKEYFKAAG